MDSSLLGSTLIYSNFLQVSTLLHCHASFLFPHFIFVSLHILFCLVFHCNVLKLCWQCWAHIGVCPTCKHRCRHVTGYSDDTRRCSRAGDHAAFQGGKLDWWWLQAKVRRFCLHSQFQRHVLPCLLQDHVWPAWRESWHLRWRWNRHWNLMQSCCSGFVDRAGFLDILLVWHGWKSSSALRLLALLHHDDEIREQVSLHICCLDWPYDRFSLIRHANFWSQKLGFGLRHRQEPARWL